VYPNKKEGKNFWNCWSSTFDSREYHVTCVDLSVDEDIIAKRFAQYFAKFCANSTASGSVVMYGLSNCTIANDLE